MFKFFKKQPDSQAQRNAPGVQSTQPPDTVPITTQQENAKHRDLTRVVLRDTLRMNGIPLDWIGIESTPHSDDEDDGLRIQLVIKRWHEGLLAHAPLIQQQLLQGMQRFDPASDHSEHVVVWRIAADSGFSKTTMPAADYWLTQPAAPTSKPKFDLPPSNRDNLDDDFAATVPGDFR